MDGEAAESDEALFNRICAELQKRVTASAYEGDGECARQIRALGDWPGLRAMAATHFLDISLTLDEIGWHFLNFGEPALVEETRVGLRELGLVKLAACFDEAYEIVKPLLESVKDPGDYYEGLERIGKEGRIDELSALAGSADAFPTFSDSVIYGAWLQYARKNPERVFP